MLIMQHWVYDQLLLAMKKIELRTFILKKTKVENVY